MGGYYRSNQTNTHKRTPPQDMDNPKFVTYKIKMFTSPRKLKISSHLPLEETKLKRTKQQQQQNETVIFKSTRKLQQYKLIRSSFNVINSIWFVKLGWLVWLQLNDDLIIQQNTFLQILLRGVDNGLYTILKMTDLGFIIIVFPIVSYLDSIYYKLKINTSNMFNTMVNTILPIGGWLETNIFQTINIISNPIYNLLLKISFIENQVPSQLDQDISGVMKLLLILFNLKTNLVNYIVCLILSIFTTPLNYVFHINTLFNYQLVHQNRITLESFSRICQNVAFEIWMEWVSYFQKDRTDTYS